MLEPGALRRAAPCPIAGECGGCDWTALRLDHQLEAKKKILIESLRRIGKIREHPPIAIHPSPLNYRLRSRLQSEGDAVGFYATGSHRVVPLVPECEVVGIETAKHPMGGVTWEVDERLIREGEVVIKVGEFTYRLSTSSFFQVNRHLLSTLLRLVSAHAGRVKRKGLAIDFYAGVGFFTLPLMQVFDRVIAVEGARDPYTTIEITHTAVENFDIPEADFIFLDPPRAGTRKSIVERIGRQAREMICYLSCDPVTFSRDASRLIASGWRLATLDLIDLFPNTHHVETLASFERARLP
jgi:tRNA/tmRNA/rRNA uracil-C5-methylase (TrmA/RlmC/RlmD family)